MAKFSDLSGAAQQAYIRKLVREELGLMMADRSAGYVGLKELCEQLCLTRQTVNKWLKDAERKKLFEPYIKHEGKRVRYLAAGIMRALEAKGLLPYKALLKMHETDNDTRL